MTLSIYLFKKFILSITICTVVTYLIFFIFSLIGNLSENFSFISILYISLLNALQIFTYIPSHLFILSICLFVLDLKSRNELMIVKEYTKLRGLILVILPILILFILLEYKKDNASLSLEKFKSNLINERNLNNIKLLIEYDDNKKTYSIFNKNIEDNDIVEQYLSYQIRNFEIESGTFSSNLNLKENDLFSYETILYNNNNFQIDTSENKLFDNFSIFWSENPETIIKKNSTTLNSNYTIIMSNVFTTLFYLCAAIVFLSKKLVKRNVNFLRIFLLVLFIFFYHLIIPKIMINNFHYYFQFISLIVFLLIFLKIKKYE